MYKDGLETYKDLIKIFILLLCISNRQDKDNRNCNDSIIISTSIHVCHHVITTYTTN